MMRQLCRVVVAIVAMGFITPISTALTISTTPPNSGAGGAWMNLTATNTTLYVTSFGVYFQNATVGTAATVQIWRRPGTYVGFTGAATGWTLHQTISTASAGQTTLVTLNLSTPITLAIGQTEAVYIQCVTTGNGIRYVNPPAQTTWTNADLTLYSEHARAAATAFGAANTPRGFAGVVNYIRDPAAMGACCRQDGMCTSGTPGDCDANPAGLWQGQNSTCGTVVCPQLGACCGPQDGTCTQAVQWNCLSPNSFTSEGNACTPTTCPQGACCKPDGSCTSVTQTWCQTTGGVYTFDTQTCGAAACPQPGACCLSNGGCLPLTAADCTNVGGTASAAGVLCAAGGCWTSPILYHNGGVVTHPFGGGGGADASQAPAGSNTVGANFNNGAFKVSSPFTIPTGEVWTVDSFHTLGYQTGAPTSPLPYTTLFVRIWDRDPRLAGATVIWGDLTTNTLDTITSAWSNIYRMANNVVVTDTTRPLFKLIANVPSVNLAHGTYWVEWTAQNGATPFIPPVTTPQGIPFGLALQSNAANVFTRMQDTTYQSATWSNNPGGFPYAIPFVLEGTVGVGGVCCQTDGSCVATVGDPLVCASGTAVPGGTCAPNTCPQPEGACCLADGSCVFGLAAACIPSGGVYTSDNTTCVAAACPQPGACCLGNGGCARLVASECSDAGGTFAGAGVLCAAGNCWTSPILYHNGGIVTDPGAGTGGEDVSQVALTSTTAGYSWNFPTGFRVAEDFTIPAGQTWSVSTFRTWGYQTDAPASPLPFTEMYVRVFDRNPGDPGAVLLWGDLTTNRLDTVNSVFSNIYRVFNGALTNTQRPVFNLIADVSGLLLPAGTYWVEYSATNGATANIPHVTVPAFIPFGNAVQFNTTWNPMRDGNFQAPAYSAVGGKPFGVPFILEGETVEVGVCCLSDGSCAAAIPGNPAMCASGTLVPNGTCSPNTCPAPAGGVCCRGATCSTAYADATACAAAYTTTTAAVTKFVSNQTACNTPLTTPGMLGNTTNPCCYANYNHNTTLEVQDIFDFLNDWFAGNKGALVGGDGSTGTLAVQNIFDFLNAWFAGGCN